MVYDQYQKNYLLRFCSSLNSVDVNVLRPARVAQTDGMRSRIKRRVVPAVLEAECCTILIEKNRCTAIDGDLNIATAGVTCED